MSAAKIAFFIIHAKHIVRKTGSLCGCLKNGDYYNDGYARAFAKGTGLQEQQQKEPDLSLTFHKAVVGYSMGKLPTHMLADIAQVEGLQVTEVTGVEQHQYGHDLAVGHEAGTVAVAFARYG